MVGRNVYLSICVVGFVFTLLTLLTDQPIETALTIAYITLTAILILKFLEEWRYFQHYNAPIASGIFIGIPSLIAYGGTLIAHTASLGENDFLRSSFFEISLDIEFINGGNYFVFLNIFSIIFVLPFFIFLLFLLQKYYSNRYPSIFIFRRKVPNKIVILYNLCIILSLAFFWIQTRIIEFSGLCFVSVSIIFLIQYYILKVVLVPIRRVTVNRLPQQTLGRSFIVNRTSSVSPRNANSQPRTNQASLLQPRSVPQMSRTPRSESINSVTVAPGIQTGRTVTRIDRLNPAIITKLIPSGQHLSHDDFRCIFCYGFPTEPDKKVVICPHCGHPAHSLELEKWLSVADICSRCNKPISTKKMYRLSGKNYEKLIKMFQENLLNNRWG
ncbi:MAG: hypothetical protein ACFFB2_02960 [Promethearchaeota archaeon]